MAFAKLKQAKDFIKNIFDKENKLVYITETNDWSIKHDGQEIIGSLNSQGLIKGKTALTPAGLKNKIIHFGSINAFLGNGFGKINPKNKNIVTWFHVVPDDQRLKHIGFLNEKIDLLVTSCSATKKELLKNGLKEEKIIVIPLGVNLKKFKVFPPEKKAEIKKRLGLAEDKIIIGSFQKDGNGWGKGLEPKMIKGPDIFCDAVIRLAQKYPIEVLLTGPARGYVKERLAKAGISFKHVFYGRGHEAADCYNCLDLYIIASRVEGGPKAIAESWAAGVPLVSTKMGMAVDILKDGQNGMLAEVGDAAGLAAAAEKIINDKNLKNRLISAGLEEAKNYSWEKIAEKYYSLVYKKML